VIGVVLFVGGMFFAQVVTPPSTTTIQNNVTVSAPPPDPAAIAEASVQSSEAILLTVVAPPPLQWANDLLGLPNVWTTTPDDLTWNNGPIRDLAGVGLAAALALIALAIFATGMGQALGQEASYGRLIFAVVLSIGNLAWWQIGVRLNNAICASLQGPDLPSMIRAHLTTNLDPGTAVGTVILVLIYAIVALLLLFTLLFRLGLVDVLIAVGSLALLCYATPQTEHFASHYARLSAGILLSQILIVLGLRVASVLGTLGNGGVVGTLISIVVLILVRSLPQTIIAGASQRQGSHWGMMALMMLRRRVGL
jgi:hypothetical protein